MAFEENEISKNSQGGTEMMKRGLAQRLPEGLADDFQVICSRVRELQEDKIRVYWLHDLPEDPETNHLADELSRNKFHKLVFCGQWQYSRYQQLLGVPYDQKSVVIDTAIDPFEAEVIKNKPNDVIRLVYSSTPQRGLEILVPVFEELAKKHDNIHLDVFSSFKIYGWGHADKQYEALYERIRNHPKMTYHGFATNEVVRDTLKKAHIHAYPNIWPECNSRSVIEAMSAGLACVHPDYCGLTDTSGGMTMMYHGDRDHNIHAAIFHQALDFTINNIKKNSFQNQLMLAKIYADNRYSWQKITTQWTSLLEGLKEQYPTLESRSLPEEPKEVFVYDTHSALGR